MTTPADPSPHLLDSRLLGFVARDRTVTGAALHAAEDTHGGGWASPASSALVPSGSASQVRDFLRSAVARAPRYRAAFGWLARQQVTGISDFALSYYVEYVNAGIDHNEALRLAWLSARMGDDITNYPELAYPTDES